MASFIEGIRERQDSTNSDMVLLVLWPTERLFFAPEGAMHQSLCTYLGKIVEFPSQHWVHTGFTPKGGKMRLPYLFAREGWGRNKNISMGMSCTLYCKTLEKKTTVLFVNKIFTVFCAFYSRRTATSL